MPRAPCFLLGPSSIATPFALRCETTSSGVLVVRKQRSSLPAASLSAVNPSTAAADAQALAAYRAAFADWTAVEAPASKADYQNPRLNNHLSGDAYTQVYNDVFVNTNVNGVSVRGAPVLLHPNVVNSTPSGNPFQVLVADCVQTSTWTPVNAAGKPDAA